MKIIASVLMSLMVIGMTLQRELDNRKLEKRIRELEKKQA